MRLPTRAPTLLVSLLAGVLACPIGASGTPWSVPTVMARDEISGQTQPLAIGIEFGEVALGVTSAPFVYTYTNESGASQTLVASIDGDDAADFAIVGGTCTTLPVADGATCTVELTFTPSAEYGRTATLHLTDTVPASADIGMYGIGVLPASNVAWSSARSIGSAYTYTAGTAMARTTTSTTQYLHAIVQRYDTVKVGIYYRRSTTGTTWASTRRVNPSTQHGGRSSLAAAGSRVYVAWSSLASANPSGSKPRALWFRRGSDHGVGTWSAAVRLTSSTGRIDYPKITAAGSDVYIVYTDSNTGSVKIKISHDRGVHWSTKTLGTTSRTGTSGRIGVPVVAAAGSIVGVAWLANDSGAVKFRSSSNRGSSWSATTSLGSGAAYGSWPSIAALGNRIAVAWTTDETMVVRVRTGSSWSALMPVRWSAGSVRDYTAPWIGQVALTGTTHVGIAFEACWAGCGVALPEDYRSDVIWRESADNGATWARSQTVLACGEPASDYRYAYMPSVVWPSPTARYVMAARWYAPNELDNVVVRKGSGTP